MSWIAMPESTWPPCDVIRIADRVVILGFEDQQLLDRPLGELVVDRARDEHGPRLQHAEPETLVLGAFSSDLPAMLFPSMPVCVPMDRRLSNRSSRSRRLKSSPLMIAPFDDRSRALPRKLRARRPSRPSPLEPAGH
jgi:hypothetical protein